MATLSSTVWGMFLVVPLKPQYISSLFKQAVQKNPFVFAGFAMLEFFSKTSAAMVDGMDGFHILVTVYVAIEGDRHILHDFKQINDTQSQLHLIITKFEKISFFNILVWREYMQPRRKTGD